MASTYTTLLRLVKPTTGELEATWGDVVNAGLTSLVDTALAGTANVAHDNTANYTLTTASGSADEARAMFLNVTGVLGAARNVVCPTSSKLYFIKNATTGGFAVTLKTAAGTGVSVPNGKYMALYCDGTNVVEAVNYSGAFQPLDAQLTDVAGLTPTDNGVIIGNGTNFVVESGATLKTSLGLTIGTDVQAYDADLTTWAGVTPGTGVATALAVNVGSAGALVTNGGALGTPSSGTLTNATGLPAAGVTGTALVAAAIGTTVQAYDADLTTWAGVTPGTGIATALAINAGSTGAPILQGGAAATTSLTATSLSVDSGQANLVLSDVNVMATGTQLTFGAYGGAATATFSSTGLVLTGDVSVGTKTPATAGAAGVAGTITWDASYIYVCTATNTWRRVAHASW